MIWGFAIWARAAFLGSFARALIDRPRTAVLASVVVSALVWFRPFSRNVHASRLVELMDGLSGDPLPRSSLGRPTETAFHRARRSRRPRCPLANRWSIHRAPGATPPGASSISSSRTRTVLVRLREQARTKRAPSARCPRRSRRGRQPEHLLHLGRCPARRVAGAPPDRDPS